MPVRTKVPDLTQVEVLVQSRRRCCVCFGLNRDDSVKKGQIAHLDGDKTNNRIGNLAFLCFDHHDEYDSQTSQSKGLVRTELERYRDELASKFGNWSTRSQRDDLLNFLAFYVDLDTMTTAAVKVGGSIVFYGEQHAFDVLTTDAMESCASDVYGAHLLALDQFASWGWLTYTEEEREVDGEKGHVFISVKRKPICDKIAQRILNNRRQRGESVEEFHLCCGSAQVDCTEHRQVASNKRIEATSSLRRSDPHARR